MSPRTWGADVHRFRPAGLTAEPDLPRFVGHLDPLRLSELGYGERHRLSADSGATVPRFPHRPAASFPCSYLRCHFPRFRIPCRRLTPFSAPARAATER